VSNCCSDHAGTGCDDSSCEATVCGLDAFCCAIAWDDRCAAWANNVCSVCGAATPTPTATPTATPTPMPEPSALTALGSGIAVLALLYRRRSAFLRSRIFYG
jgi:hypothetical protein